MGTIRDIVQVGWACRIAKNSRILHVICWDCLSTRSPDGKVTYVRPDQYQHRIAARAASEPGLRYVGFDVGGAEGACRVGGEAQPNGSIGAAAPRRNVSNDT